MPRNAMTNLILAATLCLFGCNGGPALEEKPAPSSTLTSSSSGGGQDVKPVATDTQPDTPVVQQDKTSGQVDKAAGQAKGQDDKMAEKHRFVADRVFQVDKLQRVKAKVDGHTFYLWVMDTDAKRQEGMMFLLDTDFKEDDGMIFVFSNEDYRRFWMHNTHVDLDVNYCDKEGKILNSYTMKKFDETTDYSSKGPAMYVIELKAGILKKLGIKDGSKWEIPENVVSKDDGKD